jgi:hypothetical protein
MIVPAVILVVGIRDLSDVLSWTARINHDETIRFVTGWRKEKKCIRYAEADNG